MINVFKAVFLFSMFFCIAGLVGCSKKNPLINNQTVAAFRGQMTNYFFLKSDELYKKCGNFYAENTSISSEDKLKCDKWSQDQFKILQQSYQFPYDGTLENFRSADFWKIILGNNSK